VPLRNRVTPFGEIVATSARGTLMGNRGVLHDDQRQIVRDWQVRRWIACRLDFRGRQREVMPPGRYTALFFLDEATAFAAGHRPCAECRHADYLRFRAAWPARTEASIDEIDRQLHLERRSGPWRPRTHPADLAGLPMGAFIARDGAAWLVVEDALLRWSPAGYTEPAPRTAGPVQLLTPPSIVELFRNGYTPVIHPSARSSVGC
jgi:hypothetical protein